MSTAETKANKIATKEEYLYSYIEEALQSKKELEDDMLELKDELVVTCGTCFEHVKEQVSFLYPQLDLSKLYVIKVICDVQMVDDK